jgi:hypothetical protein
MVILAEDKAFHETGLLVTSFVVCSFLVVTRLFSNYAETDVDRGQWYLQGPAVIPGDYHVSLVVRFAPEDPERPVHLLEEEEPGHRVGEGHF